MGFEVGDLVIFGRRSVTRIGEITSHYPESHFSNEVFEIMIDNGVFIHLYNHEVISLPDVNMNMVDLKKYVDTMKALYPEVGLGKFSNSVVNADLLIIRYKNAVRSR